MELNEQYWTTRYETHNTGWDIGFPSTPIKEYLDQLENKKIKILIPGAGNSYEAEYAFRLGFSNTFVCDLSKSPLENLKRRVPDFPKDQLIHGNFFDIDEHFDLVIEQTFFCALDPSLREEYVRKMANVIRPTGRLVGVWFAKVFEREGPPFGGTATEYQSLFTPSFEIKTMDPCLNSIPPRLGAELFVNMKRH